MPTPDPTRSGWLCVATVLAMLLVPIGSYAGLKVDTLHDAKADFSSYRTYEWKTGPRDDSPMAKMLDGRIKSTAEAVLAKRGLQPAEPGQKPDLFLTYYGGIEDNLLLEGVRYEVAPHVVWTGASALSATRSYQVGTLIIDFADTETEQVVWSGVVSGKARTSGELRNQIEKAVKKALRKYPPK